MKVWGHIANCLEGGGTCALVTVARVDGSTPREAGARMVVRADGNFHGTIGGGTLEFEAIRRAARAAAEGIGRLSLQNVSLGPDLGQCCGGRAELAIEVLTKEHLLQARELARLETSEGSFVTCAKVQDGAVGSREVLKDKQADAFVLNCDAALNGTLIETFGEIRRPLYLFGAGHVGKALMLALAPLPFFVTWVDSRPDQFPGAVPANFRKLCTSDIAGVLEAAPRGAFVVALTHSHALDEEIMARALLCQKFDFCGVIGSRTKRVRFTKRLKARGLNEALISSMVCPIGVTAIKSKHPAAIAAGVAVDLLQRDEACFQQAAASGRLAQ